MLISFCFFDLDDWSSIKQLTAVFTVEEKDSAPASDENPLMSPNPVLSQSGLLNPLFSLKPLKSDKQQSADIVIMDTKV